MGDIFNNDFRDFIDALNNHQVEYILVGGYAVILHGYIRSTADMDVWVNKTPSNYEKLKRAYKEFGAPIFSKEDFLGDTYDVWAIGVAPNRIDIMNAVKGVLFEEAFNKCQIFHQGATAVRYIHLNHLLKAKEAAGRFKDKADIEQLTRNQDEQ
ncbi:DUF6036 family nucleotidyltransferase [Parasediminibacterium sp. JCM 36343]|uniref:DUF6036 family nucleotidyltransferase n=1 Tax=Parasediminibacterium sp. JCM 36343 TaxID=3374279 RepID=UPI00397D17D4